MNYQPTKTLGKVYSATAAAAAVSIVVWLFETYAHTDIPGEVEIALTTVFVFAAGYLTPLSAGEIAPVTDVTPRRRAQDQQQGTIELTRAIARQEAAKLLAELELSPSLRDAVQGRSADG